MLSEKIESTGHDAPQGVEIYQFRWYLRGISPLIWRRVLFRSDSTLADLHYIIQIAMNWRNSYLHRFTIYGKHFAILRHGVVEARGTDDVRLDELGLRLNGRFLYEYSFFDWWAHEIRLKKKLPIRANKTTQCASAQAAQRRLKTVAARMVLCSARITTPRPISSFDSWSYAARSAMAKAPMTRI